MYSAIIVEEGAPAVCRSLSEDDLPDGEVLVRVDYSTLNYKDALAITGKGPVVRAFPMVPGIDLAGVVERSEDSRYRPGEEVIVNGWGLGETHWGGLAQMARVRGDWITPLPLAFDARQAMAIGTAGYTAMLSILALEAHHVRPDDGPILVTGATGGVGSIAVALLARRGYRVTASTGRAAEHDYLRRLGATEIVDRATLAAPGKPLQKPRWAGVVDSVGSHTLVNACAGTQDNGVVTACGLAQGMDFPGTVAPFILRGVTLAGINSVYQPREHRQRAWQRLAEDVDPAMLDTMTTQVGLHDAIEAAHGLLAGKVRGRLVVDVNR